MIDELHICGIYMPSGLVWAAMAGLLVFALRTALQRLPLEKVLWHPGLLELALFFLAWRALVALGDAHHLF